MRARFSRNSSVCEKYKVAIAESAQRDLARIFDYIASQHPRTASQFVLELEKKACGLEAYPQRHPFIAENEYFGTDYRHLIHKKYRIIYRIAGDTVFIARIVHGAMLLD